MNCFVSKVRFEILKIAFAGHETDTFDLRDLAFPVFVFATCELTY